MGSKLPFYFIFKTNYNDEYGDRTSFLYLFDTHVKGHDCSQLEYYNVDVGYYYQMLQFIMKNSRQRFNFLLRKF